MFGFLLKLLVLVAIVGGLYVFAYPRMSTLKSSLPSFGSTISQVKSLDFKGVSQALSFQLDRLVTHTDRSPMVMGIEITNQSLNAVVDSLQNLPPDQFQQIKTIICQPASPSAQ